MSCIQCIRKVFRPITYGHGPTVDSASQSRSHDVKGIVRRTQRQDRVKAHICGRVPNLSAALNVTKTVVASIVLKFKKFGTSNWGIRALVSEVTKNPIGALSEL